MKRGCKCIEEPVKYLQNTGVSVYEHLDRFSGLEGLTHLLRLQLPKRFLLYRTEYGRELGLFQALFCLNYCKF